MFVRALIRHDKWRKGSLSIALLLGLMVGLPASFSKFWAQENELLLKKQDNWTIASVIIPASQSTVWEVLSRYEITGPQMPDIKAAKVLRRSGNLIKLRQTYQAPYTFGLAIDAVLEVEETPQSKISYRLLKGDFISKLEGSWILKEVSKGTMITHRILIQPELPEVLRPVFTELSDENLTRSMRILSQVILKASKSQHL